MIYDTPTPLEKFQNKLAEEPNTASTDVQVLEHELALCKVRGYA